MALFQATDPIDPADTGVDYKIDWAPYIGALTIIASEWRIEGPDSVMTISGDTLTATSTFVDVDGGTHDTKYDAVNKVTLSNGKKRERSIQIPVYNL